MTGKITEFSLRTVPRLLTVTGEVVIRGARGALILVEESTVADVDIFSGEIVVKLDLTALYALTNERCNSQTFWGRVFRHLIPAPYGWTQHHTDDG